MTEDHRRTGAELPQGVLLDEPDFLREIVERVVQELLEAEMTEHVGAAPPRAHREPQGPQAENLAHEGGHAEPARPAGPGGDLLHAPLLLLPAQREGARFGVDGDVRGGSLHQEGQGRNRVGLSRFGRQIFATRRRLLPLYPPRNLPDSGIPAQSESAAGYRRPRKTRTSHFSPPPWWATISCPTTHA